ncbi:MULTISPECIES: hypothetical protein [Haloferax]|uniref:hypothetical protein n=1 Tax=Haloferax TaxID=2251 RepID=UPI001CDA2819|nr:MULTISPECIES: hypothetical protein [Haloferax]
MGLANLSETSGPKLVVIKDPKVGNHTHEERAQLRSLPLLEEFGFGRFLHTPLWESGFKIVDYEHLDPNGLNTADLSYPVVHTVSSAGLTDYPIDHNGIERMGEQHLMREILRSRGDNDIYVIVTDTNAPKTPAYDQQRPINDEFGPITTIKYPNLLEQYVRKNLDSAIPFSETRNYFFHEVSDHHRSVGAPADTLPALFDYQQAPPDSRVWEPLYYFVEHDLENVLTKYTERMRETLRSWLERDYVQKIANEMDAMLVQCDFDVEELDKQRERNAALYDND